MKIFGPKKRQDDIVDATSFNREDSTESRSDDAYKAFTKDRRTRTVSKNRSAAIYSTADNKDEYSSEFKRKSYNPNFSRDNKVFNQNYMNTENRHSLYDKKNYQRSSDNSDTNYRTNIENNFFSSRKRFNSNKTNYKSTRLEFNKYGTETNSENEYHTKFNQERNNYRKKSYPDYNKKRYEKSDNYKNKRYNYNNNEYTADNYPKYPAPIIEDSIRLNRYIAMSGICSRREADEYITAGRVTVNDNIITELGSKVAQNDVIKIDGKIIENEKKVYILMNKPKGYVTSIDDPHADKTVMDLLHNACKERIYPIGRLDKNSLGVLLFTNDGDLAKKLTHPSYEKKKVYQVTLNKPLTKSDMEQIAEGITLEDGEIHADEISYVNDKKNEIGIEIHSGRNRIVRRIFDHMGYKVTKLDRVYFAGLTKLKLKRGAWRFLTPKEVSMLKAGSYE